MDAGYPAPVPFDTTITGTILNEKNESLTGATVTVKATGATATTNDKGAFTLVVPNGNATLVVSYVGYLTQELRLGNRATVTVTLYAESKSLEDVVVVGYGTRKRGM
ncbi:carboxypeptidase-like regulatory domain-containing protein [Paraflavitalea speifideaquila]|uniref:carboxypeptidase-like regulatory domain-containing protein n=1 Tax=Paraflavitalea speifideaquila TaxID=3076558 RepID=UPI0028E5574D|nr:carboxypeptidase-like regulatory domain-containing protein [Paraflavitalea speifideiaquila]